MVLFVLIRRLRHSGGNNSIHVSPKNVQKHHTLSKVRSRVKVRMNMDVKQSEFAPSYGYEFHDLLRPMAFGHSNPFAIVGNI